MEDDATPAEKQINLFLNMSGVFQINVKQQLEIERKETLNVS